MDGIEKMTISEVTKVAQTNEVGIAPGGGGFTPNAFGAVKRPKHPSKSGMKNKPHSHGDRPIDFLKCRVVIFLFLFFVESGLFNSNPFPRWATNHPHEAL